MKVASLFSGIGGFDLGFQRAGMEIVFQCETSNFARKVLEKHWPHVQRHGDISSLNASDIPEADLYCGGFPCQDVSLANQGKRKGLKGERSGLFYQFSRLVRQNKPKWIVLENVPGLLSSQKGEDFGVVAKTLDEIGYGVAWRILDAKYFGTPQRRRRVFIIASYKSLSAVEVLFGEQTSQLSVAKSNGQKQTPAEGSGASNQEADLYTIQHAAIGRGHRAGPQGKGYRNDGETWTLDHRGNADALCSANAPFGVRAPAGVSSRVDRRRYAALGNAVCVPVVEWIGKRIVAIENSTKSSSTIPTDSQQYHCEILSVAQE